MKLMKNWKRIFAGMMACIMLFMSLDFGAMTAFALDKNELEKIDTESVLFPTGGLLSIEAVEVDKDEIGEVYDYEELLSIQLFSEGADTAWLDYSTKYYYNQLDDEWRNVWDALDVLMLSKLSLETGLSSDEYISAPENTTLDELRLFVELYLESNPQYYFLRGGFSYLYEYNSTYVDSFAIKSYASFRDDSERAKATAFLETEIAIAIDKINVELSKLNLEVTQQDKLQAIQSYVVTLTEYNYDIIADDPETLENEDGQITNDEEETWYTQSIYSAFKHHSTVCAGYAETMQLLCNAFNIDAVNVTSYNHKWNKVRINDSWYNVDATWADAGNGQEYAVYYGYYGRSDAFYEADHASHVMEEHWDAYVPLCAQDSVSKEPDSYKPDWVARDFYIPEEPVSTPQISVLKTGSNTYQVSIIASEGVVYYTLDGTEPSCASSKSYIYSEPFYVEEEYTVKAIAVLDGYWDSEIAYGEKIKSVKNPMINDHFYNKMTLQWDVLEEATGYIVDIYQGTEKLTENKINTILINDKDKNSYVLDTSTYAPGTNIFYEIRAYVGDVTNLSEVATSQIYKTKTQPLNVDVKWHVTKFNNVDYIVLDVKEILDGNATLQDEMWIWYYSDISKIAPDASFKIDLSNGKNGFMYTYSEHGISFGKTGYLYVTNEDKTSAFQDVAFVVGGEYVAPELLPIEDKEAQTAGETIVLQAVISPETVMENFHYTYQWFVAEDEFATGTAIEGATSDTYRMQIGSFDEKFYYCKVTAEYSVANVYTTFNGTTLESGQKEHTRVAGELFGSQVTISPITDKTYTGYEIAPELTITDTNTGKVLIKDEDYTVTYTDNTDVKKDVEGTVIFVGDYANANNAKVYFNIVPKNVEDNDSIDVYKVDNVFYTGSAYRPNGEVWDTDRNVKLVENVDYKVSFSNNTDAGTSVVTLDFIGNYTGTRFINFRILPKDISDEVVDISNNGSKEYTGQAIIPNLVIEYGNEKLVYERDYELDCTNNTNVGTAYVTVRFKGNYTGKQKTTFTIIQRDINKLTSESFKIEAIANQEYTGHAITPALTIRYINEADSIITLKEGTDYTATYTDNVNQGTATVTIEFTGNYTGNCTIQFEIVARSAENLTFEAIEPVAYTGEALMPKPVIKNGNLLLVEGTDYELSYSNNIKVGDETAVITATFKGNYYGTKEILFTILPRDAQDCTVKFVVPNQVYSYNGQVIKPEVIVKYGDKLLVEDTDYTVVYNYDKNVGIKKVQVDFKGNYTGRSYVEFSVISKSISAADLILDGIIDFFFDGTEKNPEITIIDPAIKDENVEDETTESLGHVLRKGIDYVITFIDNIFAGIATIQIEFVEGGNYVGDIIYRTFVIKERTTEHVVISAIPEQRYTGSAITPEVVIKDTEIEFTLVKDRDYTVEYKNNINEGTATVVVSFEGNFKGDPMTTTFTIVNPVPTSITSNTFHVNQSTGYISKVTVGTTVNTLWSSLNERDYVVIYDKNGNVVSGTTVLATGMTAVIMDEGTSTKKYTVVVTGDTNGDGKINITDMIAVKACTLKKSGLSGAYEKAGDVNGDGKINITDFIKVKATTLKKDSITGVAVK